MKFSTISDAKNWTENINGYEHDFYHTWDYHRVSAKNGEGQPILFKLTEGGYSVLYPLLERPVPENDQYKDLISVYGYPGPLFSTEDTEVQNQLLKQLFKQIADLNYVSLFSRLHPIINGDGLDCSENVGDVVYCDLTKSLEEIYAAMRKNLSRDIRKLKASEFLIAKHAEIGNQEISDFKHVYDTTMTKLEAEDHYFFSEEYFKDFLSSNAYETAIYTIYLEESAVASAIMVNTGSFGQYHLSGSLPEVYKRHPSKLILGFALENMLQDQKLKYFILGGGVGSKHDSLFNFKYGFGRHTAPFNVIKIIFNTETYNHLSQTHLTRTDDQAPNDINFFPLYRYKN